MNRGSFQVHLDWTDKSYESLENKSADRQNAKAKRQCLIKVQ
jgi:hypothetical protein